jgi:AcrR family transcriptional regulator
VAVGRLTPQRRRELTRTALVEAAAQVFARRGFYGASLEEIAETAGFTRGAIYKNFTDKEELFFAVRDHVNEQALAAFAEQLRKGAEAAFDADALAAIWQQADVANPEFRALFLEFRLYELRNPDVQARSAAEAERTRQMIAKLMQDNAAANGLTLKVPADTLAAILANVSEGFALNSHGDPREGEIYRAFLQLIIPATITTADKSTRRRAGTSRQHD